MPPAVLGKRSLSLAAVHEDPTGPSPRSTKRLRNLRIHEEADDDKRRADLKAQVLPANPVLRRLRGRRTAGTKNGLIIESDSANNENRQPDSDREDDEEEATHVDARDEEPVQPHYVHPNPRNAFSTPSKPRFRNALAPNTPTTPRHRITVGVKPLTPRTPRTPRALSLSSPALSKTVYTQAKQLFARNASPGQQIVGRESERDELRGVVETALTEKKGSCIYVSGPPGTGKSAVVGGLLGEFDVGEYLAAQKIEKEYGEVKTATINCASMTNAKDIYGRLIEELAGPEQADKQLFKKSPVDMLRGMFVSRTKKGATFYVVTLDEIDHLLVSTTASNSGSDGTNASSDSSSILSTLFEWSLSPYSRLLLIGIANALDLTDRFLPRLKSKNLKPILLPFLPYSPTQIAKIITSKLRSLLPASEGTPSSSQESNPTPVDFTPFLHPAAIQLCARKVASTTGDLRKAFELARRAIELIERETMQKRAAMTAEASTTSGAGVPEPGSPSHRAAATTHAKVPLEENANLATRTSVNSKFVSPPDTPGTTATSTNKSAQVPSLPVLTPATAPRATVAHVARVTASLLGTGTTERLAGLTLQQKAALCALVALGKKNAAAAGDDKPVPRTPSKRSSSSSAYKATPSSTSAAQAPTIKALFATYVSLCRRDNALAPLSSSEFNDVVSSLETSGLVSLQSHGSGPASRSRSGSGPSMPSTPSRTPSRRGRAGAARDNGETVVTCHVNEKEVLDGLVGAGEGVLRKLVAEEN